ncbi:sugar ABC transporter permease [Thiospirochaeta perfilievii]|uniref:Sugar ABC transporter permease n=1 Tax=Thiospirochaeta perfilievii TaxID=252967 RepID=A0A5C1QBM7_9SPIO|nr:sugar ABC transporter permease [Thiospirochaeta perfilievii]QEN04917.1 sugar ABC transporter permease [Thiospirochaeta perfilievii]
MDKVLRDKRAILLFVLPGLTLFLLVVIIPMFTSIYYSLLDWNGFGDRTFIGLKNYYELFSGKVFSFNKSIINGFYLTFLTLLFQFPMALVLALILSSEIKGEGFFRTVYFIPVMLSAVVIAMLFQRIYDPNYGLLHMVLLKLGLQSWAEVTLLGNPKTAMTAASFPILWQWVGYHMLLLYAGAKSVPTELREAAKIDGAGPVTTVFRIVLPLMLPVIKVCIVMLIIGSIKEFDVIFTMTKGGPVNSSQMPSLVMIETIFRRYKYGMGSAMAMCIVLLCLLITALLQKIFDRKDP